MGDQATRPASGTWTGRVLRGKYRIIDRLGSGGWGAVYAAEHLLLRRSVAIKLLHPDVAADPRFAERFRREALAASRIGHPNIIEVIDLDRTDEGTEFMVLELLKGESLGQILEETGGLPLARALDVFEQVASGLSAAHRVGIVHRDLKPDNVFLCRREDGTELAKVLDFGIAKMTGSIGGTTGSITHTGAVLGTPVYMPPEQIRGDRTIDARADLFSLGVMMYEALSGSVPFDANNLPQLVMKILEEPPVPLASHRPDLPPKLTEMIGRMLAKSAADRPESADVVLECIREARAELALSANLPIATDPRTAIANDGDDEPDDDAVTMIMKSPLSDEVSSPALAMPKPTAERAEPSAPSIVVKDMGPPPPRPAPAAIRQERPVAAPPPVRSPREAPTRDPLAFVLGAIAFIAIASISYWIVSHL